MRVPAVFASFAAVSLLLVSLASSAAASPWIEISLDPAIPGSLHNPGGVLHASCWMHEADPLQTWMLRITIRDPQDDIVFTQDISQQAYVSMDWTVPSGLPDGVYHYQVQYFSDTWDTSSQAGFLLIGTTAGICSYKFIDVDGNGIYDPTVDQLATGWEICTTPPLSPPCQVTGPDFVVCWFFLPTGSYTVCETQQPGYTPTTPPCQTVSVSPGVIQKVEFGNAVTPPTGACCFAPSGDCQVLSQADCVAQGGSYMGDSVPCAPGLCPVTATEQKTWGSVKQIYR